MKNIKSFLLPVAILVLMFLFAGCQSFDGPSQLTTAKGVKVEKLLRNDSFMVSKMGADSQEQFDAMMNLGKKFPQDPYKLLIDSMRSEVNSGDKGVSFDDDVLPVIGESPRLMLGFAMNDSSEEPEIVFAMEVKDTDKAQALLQKLVSDEMGTEEDYKGFKVYSANDGSNYGALYRDVLLMAPKKEIITASIDRGESNGENTLLNNQNYQKTVAGLNDNLGYFFIDPSSAITNAINDTSSEEVQDLQDVQQYVEAIEGEVFAFSAENDGLRMKMKVVGDEEKMKELGYPINEEMLDAYLYKQLPGDNLMFYSESSNLKVSLQMLEKIYSQMEDFASAIKQVKAAVQLAGIDYDNELLPMLDKGYALSIYQDSGVIPQFGLFFDVSSKVPTAEKIIALVNSGLRGAMVQYQTEFGDAFSFNSEGGDKLLVDLSKLPDEVKSDLPVPLQSYQGEFNYGIKDDVMYMALYKGLTRGGFDVVAENEEFNKAIGYIPGYKKGVTFIDVGKITEYVTAILQNYTQSLPDEYVMARSYLTPVKSIVVSGGSFDNGIAEVEGFIRIE